jgi:phosphohistidine phosphatase SixA
VVDPALTERGQGQTGTVGEAFEREIGRGMPEPTLFFVSPLRRCGETLQQEWGWSVKAKTGSSAVTAQVVPVRDDNKPSG